MSAVEEYRTAETSWDDLCWIPGAERDSTWGAQYFAASRNTIQLANAALAEMEAENGRLQKRESDLEYIAEKWCEHECVASDCTGCPLQRRATP